MSRWCCPKTPYLIHNNPLFPSIEQSLFKYLMKIKGMTRILIENNADLKAQGHEYVSCCSLLIERISAVQFQRTISQRITSEVHSTYCLVYCNKIKMNVFYPRQLDKPHWFTCLGCRANCKVTLDWVSNGQALDYLPHRLHPHYVYLYFENVCQTDGNIATSIRWKGSTVFLCCWVML